MYSLSEQHLTFPVVRAMYVWCPEEPDMKVAWKFVEATRLEQCAMTSAGALKRLRLYAGNWDTISQVSLI